MVKPLRLSLVLLGIPLNLAEISAGSSISLEEIPRLLQEWSEKLTAALPELNMIFVGDSCRLERWYKTAPGGHLQSKWCARLGQPDRQNESGDRTRIVEQYINAYLAKGAIRMCLDTESAIWCWVNRCN